MPEARRLRGPVDQRSDISKGDRMIGWGGISSGLRSRLRVQVRAQGRGRESGPGPVPEPEHLNLIPDGRDLGPENDHMAAASHPVSGFPLRLYQGRADRPGQLRLSEGAPPYPRHLGQHAVLPLPRDSRNKKGRPQAPSLIPRVTVSPCPRDPCGAIRRVSLRSTSG